MAKSGILEEVRRGESVDASQDDQCCYYGPETGYAMHRADLCH
jgi:hypothetical protein